MGWEDKADGGSGNARRASFEEIAVAEIEYKIQVVVNALGGRKGAENARGSRGTYT